ncbi:MAG: 6-phosphogluconolactonase [Desulfovibrionaceae bacterium]
MTPRIRRFASQADMTLAALTLVSQAASRAVAERGRCLIALAGGSTPLPLYAAMARQGLGAPWETIHFFFGDERLVPVGDRRSNFGAVAPLLFTRAPIPMDNIHPMPVDVQPPERAATVYEEELRDVFGVAPGAVPRFDCLLLGLGPDGHMASLFPGSPALAPTDRLVAAVPPPTTVEPRLARLTLTVPVINAAREVLFLVASRGKEQALAAVLAGTPDPALPASLAAPQEGAGWLILDA